MLCDIGIGLLEGDIAHSRCHVSTADIRLLEVDTAHSRCCVSTGIRLLEVSTCPPPLKHLDDCCESKCLMPECVKLGSVRERHWFCAGDLLPRTTQAKESSPVQRGQKWLQSGSFSRCSLGPSLPLQTSQCISAPAINQMLEEVSCSGGHSDYLTTGLSDH